MSDTSKVIAACVFSALCGVAGFSLGQSYQIDKERPAPLQSFSRHFQYSVPSADVKTSTAISKSPPISEIWISSLPALRAMNLAAYRSVFLEGYYFANDGGGGKLCQAKCRDDGKLCFTDAAGNSFKRYNPANPLECKDKRP